MKLKRPVEKLVSVLTVLAFVMILTHTTGDSSAYFTTYVTAKGGHTVSLEDIQTKPTETFENWVKSISVENTGSAPCYVRVKVLAGSQFPISITAESSKWSSGEDGYWYYSDILPAAGLTDVLKASITVPEGLDRSFDVVVVQECVGVSYRADGTPYADWSEEVAS